MATASMCAWTYAYTDTWTTTMTTPLAQPNTWVRHKKSINNCHFHQLGYLHYHTMLQQGTIHAIIPFVCASTCHTLG